LTTNNGGRRPVLTWILAKHLAAPVVRRANEPVIGVVMVAGKPNAMFKKIVSTMPREEGSAVPADPAVHPGGLLPTQRTYYHYEGSLTTPPCSETVDWIVLTHPIEADEDDIARFAKLYPMNARPVQNRDRRFILSSGPR
jgi:carbonic anhydrase